MRWITLEDIKDQLRIEQSNHSEDRMLTRYANSAENTILTLTHRTEAELKAMNKLDPTEIPPEIWECTLFLVEHSYWSRGAVSPQQMYAVPYGFDMKIKPYVRLTRRGNVDDSEAEKLWDAIDNLDANKQDNLEFATDEDIEEYFGDENE